MRSSCSDHHAEVRQVRRRRPRKHLREGAIADAALIIACVGCCCGHAERGGPKTAPGTLKREMRRAFRQARLDGRARLAFSDCLGPCSEANVIFLYLEGRPLWLRRMNAVEPFASLLDWLHGVLHEGDRTLPPALAARTFAWTGGGDGPMPPVEA
jgi:hypothetical protein